MGAFDNDAFAATAFSANAFSLGGGAPPAVPLARNVTLTFRPQRTVAPVLTSRAVTVTFGAV
jgi:hypothetical protein